MDEELDFTGRNPVNTLNDMVRPRDHEVAFKHKRSGPDHSLRWSAQVVISPPYLNGVGEIDYGFEWSDKYGTKKDAESQAAKSAIYILRGKAFSRFRKANEIAVDKACIIGDFANKICCICHEVEDLGERTMLEYYAKRKVLAAVVMETKHSGAQNEYKVISFGTGQKIIKQGNLQTDGSAVLDCHAEVIARRGFKRYVFSELLKYIKADRNSQNELFEPAPPITDGPEKRYKVNGKIKFHLYISCPPCGDASVFRSINAKGKGTLAFNSKQRKQQEKQGLLRAKVADGEGTHPTDKAQDGRLRLMSCSDKILLWNMIGLQGALLNHFLEPIYLTSIVVGSQVGQQREHLPRALCERKRNWMDFPAGYVNNRIDILVAKDGFIEKWDKNGNSLHSTNWCCGDECVEIIDTKTGMVVDSFTGRDNGPSRLSKKALFNHFLKLRASTAFSGMSCSEVNYGRCKNGAPESSYVTCKQKAMGHVQQQGLGKWIKVDNSVDNFSQTL